MYKSEICEVLARLRPHPGGTTTGLIQRAVSIHPKVTEILKSVAGGNDVQKALATVLSPLREWFEGISITAAIIELYDLRQRFDRAVEDHPSLEPLLRPAMQELGQLASAIEESVNRARHSIGLVEIVMPAVIVNTCFAELSAIALILSQNTELSQGEESATIIIDGSGLDEFAAFLALITSLAKAAQNALSSSPAHFSPGDIRIESIESGSPIQVLLAGASEVLTLLLSMLKDAAREIYLGMTTHGRVVRAAETLARIKDLGVDTPEIRATLQESIAETSRQYLHSVQQRNADIVVNGESQRPRLSPPDDNAGRLLPPPSSSTAE